MEKVKEVALWALKCSEAITDAHKVALCLKYNVDMQWAKDAIQRLITRSQSLTDEDIEELITQPKMVGLISRAREALMRPVTVSPFGIAPNYQVRSGFATLPKLLTVHLESVSGKSAAGDAALPRIQVYLNYIFRGYKPRCQPYASFFDFTDDWRGHEFRSVNVSLDFRQRAS